jgi:hypothetical protein
MQPDKIVQVAQRKNGKGYVVLTFNALSVRIENVKAMADAEGIIAVNAQEMLEEILRGKQN